MGGAKREHFHFTADWLELLESHLFHGHDQSLRHIASTLHRRQKVVERWPCLVDADVRHDRRSRVSSLPHFPHNALLMYLQDR